VTVRPRQGVGPIPGEFIPITFFLVVGLVGFTFTPLGRALARRLSGDHPADVRALQDEVDGLRQDLADTRAEILHQLEDTQNRLDFAERMLAEARQKQALPGGH